MQIKTLLVASLASLGSAAVIERQAQTDLDSLLDALPSDILSAIPSDILSAIPTDILDAIPSDVNSIINEATGLFPLFTALPSTLLSEIVQAQQTLRPEDAPAFYSSILGQLPPDAQASLSNYIGSFTAGLPTGVITDIPTNTADMPTDMMTNTAEMPTETDAEMTGTQTTGAPTTSTSTKPNSAGRSYVGASMFGIVGVLAVALAL